MKRLLIVSLSALLLLTTTDCEDAHAKLKSSNEALFTVGNTTFTKGQLYSILNASSGSAVALQESLKEICGMEVPADDAMKENASSMLDSYKQMYGDFFVENLNANGLTEEEYVENLIFSEQQSNLVKKYIEENYQDVIDLYRPVQATIVYFQSEEVADTALTDLKDGAKSVTEVINEYGSSSLGNPEIITINTSIYPAEVTAYVRSGSIDDGWQKVKSSSDERTFLIHIDETDTDKIKEDVIETLSTINAVNTSSTEFYLRKYNFHIYDKGLYDAIKESNSSFIIQE